MPDVKLSIPLPAGADKIWEAIGGFNALGDWHPAVEKSELEAGGLRRRLSLVGGGTIVEQLEKHDSDGKTYTYSIIDGPLPVKNYTATLKVVEDKDGKSKVEWSSTFDAVGVPDDAIKAIQGVYQAGFDNLKKMFGMT